MIRVSRNYDLKKIVFTFYFSVNKIVLNLAPFYLKWQQNVNGRQVIFVVCQ